MKIYNKEISNIFVFDIMNHVTPIFKEWSYGLSELGYKIFYFPIEFCNIDSWHLAKVKPDLVLIHKNIQPNEINLFLDFKKKNPECRIVALFDYEYTAYKELVGVIDFYVTLQLKSKFLHDKVSSCGFKLYDMLLAGNNNFFYPSNLNKKYDICWIGYLYHGYRGEDKFLYPLLDNPKYKCFLGGIKYKNYNHGHVAFESMNEIRCSSKININFHVPYQKPGQGIDDNQISINQTVFNTPLSKSFQLCDHPYVLDIFDGSIPIGNESNWIDLVDKYLNDDKERLNLAEKSYKIAVEKHTWLVRMKEFCELFVNHFKN